jgi:hypothetical protein
LPIKRYHTALLLAMCFLCAYPAVTQGTKVGPKETIAPPANSKDPEMDHMTQLVTSLKAEIPSIQDPAARKAAEDNLDLWQHLIDKMLLENKGANNSGLAHHHETAVSNPALKQAPKPK